MNSLFSNFNVNTGALINCGTYFFQLLNIHSTLKQYVYVFFNKETDTFITLYFVFGRNDMFSKSQVVQANKLNVNEMFLYYIYEIFDSDPHLLQQKVQYDLMDNTQRTTSIVESVKQLFNNKESGYITFTSFYEVSTIPIIEHYVSVPMSIVEKHIKNIYEELLSQNYQLFYSYSQKSNNIYFKSQTKKILNNLNMSFAYVSDTTYEMYKLINDVFDKYILQ